MGALDARLEDENALVQMKSLAKPKPKQFNKDMKAFMKLQEEITEFKNEIGSKFKTKTMGHGSHFDVVSGTVNDVYNKAIAMGVETQVQDWYTDQLLSHNGDTQAMMMHDKATGKMVATTTGDGDEDVPDIYTEEETRKVCAVLVTYREEEGGPKYWRCENIEVFEGQDDNDELKWYDYGFCYVGK